MASVAGLRCTVSGYELYNAGAARTLKKGVVRVPCLVFGFYPDQDAGQTSPSWGVSQPPPKRRPGPRDARKIGLRSPRGRLAAVCKQAWSAAPHMDEPRLPETLAMGGKTSGETPHCFARRATRRGFG